MAYKVNLKHIIQQLVDGFPILNSIYLFGSRRFGSRSIRSDIDLMVTVQEGDHLKDSDVREFVAETCNALDIFLLDGGRAVSCMNDSYVWAQNSGELIAKLDALLLWDRCRGFTEASVEWVQEISEYVTYPPTALPNAYLDNCFLDARLKAAEEQALPIRPYIGDSIDKATEQVIDVFDQMVFPSEEFSARGAARQGWPSKLQSEYDCQDLIYLVLKPWLRSVPREEVTIRFDGQDKIADFNLFESRLIIEAKYIDSEAKKREVVKTLEGLSRFYTQNANVKVLLMLIFYTIDEIDAPRWESDFTHFTISPRVITKMLRVRG